MTNQELLTSEYINKRKFLIHFASTFLGTDNIYVEDIVSSSFEKAFVNIHQFDPNKSKMITWLTTICKNEVLIHIRKKKSRRNVELKDSDDFVIEDETPDIEDDQIMPTLLKILDKSKYLNKKPQYREMFMKFQFEKKSYQELAAEYSYTVQNVKSIFNRIRKDLGIAKSIRLRPVKSKKLKFVEKNILLAANGKYRASALGNYLGHFNTLEEAREAVKIYKEGKTTTNV